MRNGQRGDDELRQFSLEWDIQPQAAASLLLKMGNTHVICGVSIEDKVPPFLVGTGSGWITAEYGILPCATNSRYRRETRGQSGRTMEIQRLIGRSLRAMVDLVSLGEYCLRVDCDVLNADGGTRTAAITGGALAVRAAIEKMVLEGLLVRNIPVTPVAAVSAGIVDGRPMLDLDYSEDSRAQADGNFVMTRNGDWIEIQATAEGKPFSPEQFAKVAALAQKGIRELFFLWESFA